MVYNKYIKMKLYIENYNIKHFINNLKNLEKHESYQQSKSEIYSDEGIYYINDVHLYKCIIEDGIIKTIPNYYKDFTALTDNSKISYVEAFQIPFNHIIIHIIEFHYLLNNPKIMLVIKGKHDIDKLDIDSHKYLTFMDFYFEIHDTLDIHDKIVKKEISEFLSMLK